MNDTIQAVQVDDSNESPKVWAVKVGVQSLQNNSSIIDECGSPDCGCHGDCGGGDVVCNHD